MWWIIWTDEWGDTYAVSFDHEPTNEDIAASSSSGYWMVGYPVQATDEAEAIEKAEALENNAA